MYGFGGLWQVEVGMSQRDGRTTKRKDRATQPLDNGRLRCANRRRNITCTQDTDVMTTLQGDKGEGSLLAGKPDDLQMS